MLSQRKNIPIRRILKQKLLKLGFPRTPSGRPSLGTMILYIKSLSESAFHAKTSFYEWRRLICYKVPAFKPWLLTPLKLWPFCERNEALKLQCDLRKIKELSHSRNCQSKLSVQSCPRSCNFSFTVSVIVHRLISWWRKNSCLPFLSSWIAKTGNLVMHIPFL